MHISLRPERETVSLRPHWYIRRPVSTENGADFCLDPFMARSVYIGAIGLGVVM
jgi:hypothetical protein